MKKICILPCMLFLVAVLWHLGTFAYNQDPYVPGNLNFWVDEQLIVKGMSSSVMTLAKEKSQILGAPITSALPLSERAKQWMERKFVEAREYGTTMFSIYYFDPQGSTPETGVEHATACYYEAGITPLSDTNGTVGFFVKVRQYRYYCPLELEWIY